MVQILTKYSDFLNIFLKKKTLVLSETTNLNEYTITLQKGPQLFYTSIYSLSPVKLEILKIYLETKLANNFI